VNPEKKEYSIGQRGLGTNSPTSCGNPGRETDCNGSYLEGRSASTAFSEMALEEWWFRSTFPCSPEVRKIISSTSGAIWKTGRL